MICGKERESAVDLEIGEIKKALSDFPSKWGMERTGTKGNIEKKKEIIIEKWRN